MMPDRHWRQIIPDLVQERVNTQVVIRQAAVFADTVFCRLLGWSRSEPSPSRLRPEPNLLLLNNNNQRSGRNKIYPLHEEILRLNDANSIQTSEVSS